MKTGKLFGVGIGPGDPRYLTLRAVEVLRLVETIFSVVGGNSKYSVSGQVIDSVSGVTARKVELSFSMARDWERRRRVLNDNADRIVGELEKGHDCAFATLGDPLTYSTFGYLLPLVKARLPELEVEIVPGITSFAALAAKAQTVLVEDDEVLRVIPGQNAARPESLALEPKSANVILKSYRNRNRLVEHFAKDPDCRLVYGSRLCLKGEFIATGADEIIARPDEYLSLMMIKKK